MKKRFVSSLFIVALAVVLVLAGCGGGGSSSSGGGTTAPPASSGGGTTAPPASGGDAPLETVTWRIASQSNDEVVCAVMLKEMAEEIANRTNGGFIIDVYTNASLGSDREIAEGVQAGIIEAGQSTLAVLANFCPELGVADMPYLIPNWDAAMTFLDSEVMDVQAAALAQNGFVYLGAICYGFRQCTNNVRPISQLSDFSGIKFRVMQSDIYIDTFQALGAYPVGMAKAELITALQQNTVDGQENPMEINFNEGMAEVQKYLSKTSHVAAIQGYVANPDAFNKLPAEYQEVLMDVFKKGTMEMTVVYAEEEEFFAQKLVEAGMEYNTVSDADLAEMRQVCIEQVWPKYEELYADQLAIVRTLF